MSRTYEQAAAAWACTQFEGYTPADIAKVEFDIENLSACPTCGDEMVVRVTISTTNGQRLVVEEDRWSLGDLIKAIVEAGKDR